MAVNWVTEMSAYVNGCISRQLTESSPQAEQPDWVSAPLRPHQLSLLEAAQRLENCGATVSDAGLLTHYGVLADRVGAGKSLVALSLAGMKPPTTAKFDILSSGGAHLMKMTTMPDVVDISAGVGVGGAEFMAGLTAASRATGHRGKLYLRTALLIVPHNVVPQWETYIREQTRLQAVVVKKTRDCNYEDAGYHRRVLSADVVLVSCTMWKRFVGAMCFHGQHFQQFVWSRLFVDEADTIHVTLRAGELDARFMWFITGSWLNMLFPCGLHSYTVSGLPTAVRDLIGGGAVRGIMSARYGVVSTMLSDTRDPRFTATILRNADTWVDTSLKRPVIVHENVVCRAPANLNILQGHISPAAMEALHAGDTAGALTALGLKTASKETLAQQVTASLRADLLQAEKILEFKRSMEYSSAAAKAHGIEKAEAKVAKIKEQLAALEDRVAKAAAELCPICYDTPSTPTLTPCCRNAFCLACVCECLTKKSACPLCRMPIASAKDLMVLGDSDEGGAGGVGGGTGESGPPTKGAALLRLLSAATPADRFLVFSAHEASFKGLREVLGARGVRCELLSGTAARVDKLRKQFRDGEVQVLCMNARHVGAGINLEAATHVVLYHKMNTELEKQVIGRAVRFERAAELRVVHLVHEMETASNGSLGSEIIVHV